VTKGLFLKIKALEKELEAIGCYRLNDIESDEELEGIDKIVQ
jgi:hypothetical protein